MRIYPASASDHGVVGEEGPQKRIRFHSSSFFCSPNPVSGGKTLTAIDAAFERDVIVIMYDDDHFFYTQLINPDTHNAEALKMAFRNQGHHIYRLLKNPSHDDDTTVAR